MHDALEDRGRSAGQQIARIVWATMTLETRSRRLNEVYKGIGENGRYFAFYHGR